VILRRRAVVLAGVGGGAALAAGCGGGEAAGERAAAAASDDEVLAFLGTLEAVETAFWSAVVERDALGPLGGTALAEAVLRNERAHLAEVERVLAQRAGGAAVARPRTAVALEDGPRAVAREAAALEAVAAGAYLGQAARLQDRDLVARVVAAHSVEARQAAAVGALAGRDGLAAGPFPAPLSIAAVLDRLDPYLA
jgi:ABC-type glycerol-3-phosphate transport system substrate-binding protein